MRTFNNLNEWRVRRKGFSADTQIGFVPTMGALHSGHLELMRRSRESNTISVVSIYVNPTQFNNAEDYEKYPRILEQDMRMLETAEVDYLLIPDYAQLYPDKFNYRVMEQNLSPLLCGQSRPGHFLGVLTVVLKLLNLVQPHRTYFGEKDFQQLSLVKGMVDAFFIPTEVIGVPTIRESSGLALSSRNQRLSESGRKLAEQLYPIASNATTAQNARRELTQLGIDVDYLVDINGRRFLSAYIDGVRLIDNIEIKKNKNEFHQVSHTENSSDKQSTSL